MTRIILLAAFILVGITGAATAASVGLLSVQRVIDLPFVPERVEILPDGGPILVASDVRAGGSEVLTLDREGKETQRYQLIHSAAAMLVSPDGARLFVVGSLEGQGYASSIDLTAAGAAPRVTPLMEMPVVPSLDVDKDSILYIADAGSSFVVELPPESFYASAEDASAPSLFGFALYFGGGVRALAVAKDLNVAFVSGEGAARLAVVALGGANRVLDMYGRSKSGSPFPFAVAVADDVPNAEKSLSLVVASHETGELSIIDYNVTFEALDLIATATLGHAILPATVVQTVSDSTVVTQPMLLATSRQQDVILSANLYSRQIFQYARGEGHFTSLLERIGYFELPDTPVDLAIAPAGDLAAVAFANRPELVLLTPADTAAEPTNASMRELQRELTELGFDVGAVDGFGGPATNAALVSFQRQTGQSFDITDTELALEAVRAHSRSCSNSGLRCVVEGK